MSIQVVTSVLVQFIKQLMMISSAWSLVHMQWPTTGGKLIRNYFSFDSESGHLISGKGDQQDD